MPNTPEFAFFYPSAAGETYAFTAHTQIVQKVEELFLSVGEVIGSGFFSATDFNATVIAGQLNVTVNAPSRAVVGPAQARRLIISNSATVVGTGNADGVPVISSTNYFFLKKSGLFHIDQDNTNPGDGAILAFTGVTNTVEFTSINNNPTGRVNLTTILSLFSEITAARGSAASVDARLDASLEETGELKRIKYSALTPEAAIIGNVGDLHRNTATGALSIKATGAGTNTGWKLLIAVTGATLDEAANITVGSTTGTIIGTATTQKLGFFNAVPVVKPAALTAANAVAIDTTWSANEVTTMGNMRTRINEIQARLQSLGLIT